MITENIPLNGIEIQIRNSMSDFLINFSADMITSCQIKNSYCQSTKTYILWGRCYVFFVFIMCIKLKNLCKMKKILSMLPIPNSDAESLLSKSFPTKLCFHQIHILGTVQQDINI